MLMQKPMQSRASTVTDELMLTYIPAHVNMRKYDSLWLPKIVSLSLAHRFRKAFKLFDADCFSMWQFIVNAII